jgi:hypothetical protein
LLHLSQVSNDRPTRYHQEGRFDPIAIVCSIVQIFIFWVFVVMCNTWIKNTTRALPAIDEETLVVKGECGEKEAAALEVKH